MKALVTGATGFLGRRVVHHLLGAGARVRCFVRPSSDIGALARENGSLEFFRGRFDRIESCREAVAGCDVVLHLAAALKGAPAVLFSSTVIGTRQLMQACCPRRVERFLLVSSLGVYGPHRLRPGAILDERCPVDAEPHNRDPYSFSKVAQERVGWEFFREKELPLTVVRPGVIFGPGRDCLSSRVGLRFGNILVRMGGQQRLPYTYVDNCAEAVVAAATRPGIEGEAINVVDDNLPTGQELIDHYRRRGGSLRIIPIPQGAILPLAALCQWYHSWSKGQLPAVITPYKSTALWKPLRYSNAKAKAILGWKPRVSFSEGLESTFAAQPT